MLWPGRSCFLFLLLFLWDPLSNLILLCKYFSSTDLTSYCSVPRSSTPGRHGTAPLHVLRVPTPQARGPGLLPCRRPWETVLHPECVAVHPQAPRGGSLRTYLRGAVPLRLLPQELQSGVLFLREKRKRRLSIYQCFKQDVARLVMCQQPNNMNLVAGSWT